MWQKKIYQDDSTITLPHPYCDLFWVIIITGLPYFNNLWGSHVHYHLADPSFKPDWILTLQLLPQFILVIGWTGIKESIRERWVEVSWVLDMCDLRFLLEYLRKIACSFPAKTHFLFALLPQHLYSFLLVLRVTVNKTPTLLVKVSFPFLQLITI